MKYFIGGLGGSGSRLLIDLLKINNIGIGLNLNGSNDELNIDSFTKADPHYVKMNEFLDTWYEDLLNIDNIKSSDIYQYYMDRFDEYSCNDVLEKGGFKLPRSIYFLPLFLEKYPNIKFIHVMKDGRDMLYRRKKYDNHLSKTKYFEPKITNEKLKEILFWEHVNLNTNKFCEHFMKDNYLQVRYEDMITDYDITSEKILNFLGIDESNIKFGNPTLNKSKLYKYKKHNLNYTSSILEKFRY